MENDPRVPPGYSVVREGAVVLVLREDLAPGLVAAGVADPEAAAAAAGEAARIFEGRGRPVSFPMPGVEGMRVVARRYLHGGLLSGITGGLFPGAGRFLRELRLLVLLKEAGAPAPEPIGLVVRPAGAGTARGWLLTREIEGCEDLRGLLLRTENGDRTRRAALREAGKAVRVLHDLRVLHADLHVKNILCPKAGGPAVVLDLDGAELIEAGLTREQRAIQMLRLDRSLVKLGVKTKRPVPRSDRRRLVRAYLGTDRPTPEESARWRRRQRSELKRHKLLW